MDEKSSTYKITLRRILVRVVDTANGAARNEADYLAMSLGLVALVWLRCGEVSSSMD
jgi:hypothetical protein